MTPTNAFASSLQLSMAIKQHRPRQWTVWSARRGPLSQKAQITLSRRTLPSMRGLVVTGHRLTTVLLIILGPVAGGNAAPDILHRPAPIPAFAIQEAGVAYLPFWGSETPRTKWKRHRL